MAAADPMQALHAQREAMTATIAANHTDRSDGIDRFILAGLSARLSRLLAALESDLARPLGGPFGTAGRWGANGRGPEIADLIRRSAHARRPPTEAEPRPPPASRAASPSPLKGPECPARTRVIEACSTPPSSPPRPARPPERAAHRP